ncbi:MAG: hypothetical protein NXH99_00710 [Rhodobacteraceae bacterium]|nr:hypothetical protein [Paracoccaceae bacterium]
MLRIGCSPDRFFFFLAFNGFSQPGSAAAQQVVIIANCQKVIIGKKIVVSGQKVVAGNIGPVARKQVITFKQIIPGKQVIASQKIISISLGFITCQQIVTIGNRGGTGFLCGQQIIASVIGRQQVVTAVRQNRLIRNRVFGGRQQVIILFGLRQDQAIAGAPAVFELGYEIDQRPYIARLDKLLVILPKFV